MNLIEKLGIVVGDQVQYTGGTDMTIYTVKEAYSDFVVASGGTFDFLTMLGCEIQKAESLQADHEKCQHEWNETTSNGDAYRFFVCKHCDSTQNYVPFEADHCTDIRNHISPNTKVIEG